MVFGSVAHGGHAQYMKVPVSTLVPLPDALSFEAGAAISCGTGTAYGALRRLSLHGDETIAIFGQGPVGLSATQLATAMGARVIALDISAERRGLAESFGADVVIDPSDTDAVQAIRELTHGEGAHKTLDCSSSPIARRAAVQAARTWGTACFVGEGRRRHARSQPRHAASANYAGRLVDVFARRATRVRAVYCRPQHRCRPALYAPLAARPGGRGVSSIRPASDG